MNEPKKPKHQTKFAAYATLSIDNRPFAEMTVREEDEVVLADLGAFNMLFRMGPVFSIFTVLARLMDLMLTLVGNPSTQGSRFTGELARFLYRVKVYPDGVISRSTVYIDDKEKI